MMMMTKMMMTVTRLGGGGGMRQRLFKRGGYQSKNRGNYDYDRELSSIDTVPAYILSKFYVFGQGKCQSSIFFLRNKYTTFYGRQHVL